MRKLFTCLLLLALTLTGCGGKSYVCQDFLLDTEVSVTVYRSGDRAAAQESLELCGSYEKVFSRTDPDSELYRLNHRETAEVSPELAQVISLGLDYARRSNGAFDITMGGVSELWGFAAPEPQVPDFSQVAERLAHAGWEKVTVDGNAVSFADPETVIDLGAIAKGYIADRMADFLRERGVSSAVISLGGNLYCLGKKTDGSDFQVGIQYPYEERNQVIGGLPVSDQSVVTSGLYERCFMVDGTLYHHILDPETGWPVENGLLAVSIVSGKSVDADALSTACFVLGLEEGMAFIEATEDAEAVFITEDLQLHLSSGLEGVFYET